MSEFTDYLENELLDHTFGKGARAWSAPTNLYVALITATTNDASDLKSQLTEPGTGGYAPAAITFGAATGTSPTTTSNTAAITFTNTAATAWTVVGIAIVDGTTASANVLCYDNGMTDATIGQSEKLQFGAGDIDITLD